MVLIIEDEEYILDVASRALNMADIPVLTASDGEKGLELYRWHMEEISLIVLDIRMPGMSGSDTLTHLKRLNPSVRVLMSSGVATEEEINRAFDAGAVGFLVKPYTPHKLIKAVRGALAAFQQTPGRVYNVWRI